LIPEAQRHRLAPEQSNPIFESLASEFVESKMKKMRRCVRWYNSLNNSYTEKLLFKNKKKDIEALKHKLATGGVNVPTELEKIMLIEAEDIIRSRYDDLEGSKEISRLIHKKNKK